MWDYVCMRMHGAYNAHMNYIHVRSALNITQHRQSRELTLDNINEKKKEKSGIDLSVAASNSSRMYDSAKVNGA